MIQLQDGATLSRTADVVKTISDELVKIPGVVSVMQINGMNGENSAFCILKLEPWSKRKSAKLSLNSIMRQANVIVSKYPEVTGFVSSPPAIQVMGCTADLNISFLIKAIGHLINCLMRLNYYLEQHVVMLRSQVCIHLLRLLCRKVVVKN